MKNSALLGFFPSRLGLTIYKLQQHLRNAISFHLSNRKTTRALQVSDVNRCHHGDTTRLLINIRFKPTRIQFSSWSPYLSWFLRDVI